MLKTFRDKAWVLEQCTSITVKKKLLEIKLGFWDMNACCKPRFEIHTVELVLFIAPMRHTGFKRISGMKKGLWQDDRWHWVW